MTSNAAADSIVAQGLVPRLLGNQALHSQGAPASPTDNRTYPLTELHISLCGAAIVYCSTSTRPPPWELLYTASPNVSDL